MLKSNWIFSALDQGGVGRGGHCIGFIIPSMGGSVVKVQNSYDFLLDLVGKGT